MGSHPSMPPADVAVRLAKALDVTVEYLVGDNLDQTKISPRQHHLLEAFEKLSEKEKQAVEMLIQKLIS